LILFIHPDEEGLFFIMENSSSLWPFPVKTACFKESVSFLEQEVVFNQLLPLIPVIESRA